jgi:acetylornithine deacetylase
LEQARADHGIAGEPTHRISSGPTGGSLVPAHDREFAHSATLIAGTTPSSHGTGSGPPEYSSLQAQNRHALLGTPTISIGVIEGGQAVNMVPDQCRIEIDRRTLPGESAEDAVRLVKELLGDLSGWEMSEPYLAVSGMDVPEDAPIVRMLAGAARPVVGEVVLEGASYATDAGLYNSAGIPTVVFGPGNIADAHTAAIEDLHAAVQIIQNVLTASPS